MISFKDLTNSEINKRIQELSDHDFQILKEWIVIEEEKEQRKLKYNLNRPLTQKELKYITEKVFRRRL